MPMTITQKILAAHCGRDEVHPGEIIMADIDLALGNDITAPISIKILREKGIKKVFDRDRVALVPDHFAPNKDIASAQQCKDLREFARDFDITHYFELGEMGVEHALLPEKGLALPGELIIGADSHTCTYGALGAFSMGMGSTDLAGALISGKAWFKVPGAIKFVIDGKLKPWVGGKDLILYIIGKIGVDGALYQSMEFTGETVRALHMSDRLTMCNMAIEAGAKNGIIEPDEITEEYVRERTSRQWKNYSSDADAEYLDEIRINASDVDLQVAFPHLPENSRPVGEARNVAIDQVVIGSCTNGRLEDFQAAARVLKGRKVAPGVRLIMIPATPLIYRQTMEEGLFDIFLSAGAVISPPTCGPCLGGHMGILAEGEVAVATTNRNFVGRMGHPKSEVYLAGAPVAAASAVAGTISSPEDL
ncbi:MAG: 3-isopropylmalate dehydratase large subunit [bacterium]|nr:3-isopropylmalate dehydratase large subunit [bacterium]MDT8365917.1 3-isopropylmalate dehydratase large subunit [bacterium]